MDAAVGFDVVVVLAQGDEVVGVGGSAVVVFDAVVELACVCWGGASGPAAGEVSSLCVGADVVGGLVDFGFLWVELSGEGVDVF